MEHYIRFDFKTKDKPQINLYPLPCLHVGAPQCDVAFIKEHINRIKEDPYAKWIYMGDGGDCITKISKGHLFTQLYNPTEQQNILVDILSPIKDKGLFALRGNHGNRIYKETGLSFDMTLACRLGLPYLDIEAYCNINVNKSTYDIYCHHGIDSSSVLRTKIQAAEQFMSHIDADIYLTAHSHVAVELPPSSLQTFNNDSRRVVTRYRYLYICGTGYDSRDSYATEKGYKPLLPAYLSVKLDGRLIHGYPQYDVQSTIWRSDGKHEVNGQWGNKYLAHVG